MHWRIIAVTGMASVLLLGLSQRVVAAPIVEPTFSVTFTDAYGDNGEVWVVIDGESILMSPDPDDSDTSDGQDFTYEGKLVKGEHTYYFRGKDSFGNDAGGPSAGEENADTSPDVVKYQTESTPGAWATGVLLAVAAVALVASIRRRRW